MAATAEALEFEHINVAWAPLPGSQTAFLRCPVWEACYGGSRGPGKTDTLLMDFAQHVGQGFGEAWRGVIFRRREKDLKDLIAKSKRWFFRIFPGAKFIKSENEWHFPTGEVLAFAYVSDPDQYWGWHGQEWPFVGWEELTTWPDDEIYEVFKSINRSSVPGMPRKYRSTTNPWGAGHNWVKARFVDACPKDAANDPIYRTPIRDEQGNWRVYIHGLLAENVHLIKNDPDYVRRLRAIRNPELRKAWLEGDWDVNPGGFLQGIYDPKKHKVAPFAIPLHWPRWRALDWGSAKPFSCGWYAKDPDTGNIYRYRELYGYGGKPDVGVRKSYSEVAEYIKLAEANERRAKVTFRTNPADSAMWAEIGIKKAGEQITGASLMADAGVDWEPVKKGPGSRVNGANVVIDLFNKDKLFIFNTCKHWLRTVPALQPDPNNWEDVDTDMEDHCFTADTQVWTRSGLVPIGALVGQHGEARSVDGWRPFSHVRCTRSNAPVVAVTFEDGLQIRCTPDHRFMTKDGRWTEAQHLAGQQILACSAPQSNRSTVSGSICAETISSGRAGGFIARCGSRITGLFRKGLKCITSITIRGTTRTPIFKSCLVPGTSACMRLTAAYTPSVWMGVPVKQQHNGTEARTGSAGTVSTSSETFVQSTQAARSRNNARNAVRLSLPPSRDETTPVIARDDAGLARCVSVEPAGSSDVYCMRVDVTHAFCLANGAVVSNCWDELRYSVVTHHHGAPKPPEDRPGPGTFDHLTREQQQRRIGHRRFAA